MIIDAKRIWISAGYGIDNTIEASISFVTKHGLDRGLSLEIIEHVISLFFIDLSEDEAKYMFPYYKCPCGCGIDKSGTAAVHEILKRLDVKIAESSKKRNANLINELNTKILNHISEDNRKYIEEFGPKEEFIPVEKIPDIETIVIRSTWHERNFPTLLRWFGDR